MIQREEAPAVPSDPLIAFAVEAWGSVSPCLGALKAQIADLVADEGVLQAELIARKVDAAEGDLFRCTVTEAPRETLDTALLVWQLTSAYSGEPP